ncbi:tyrosine-type recombinase/integrase [Streptomyces sp. VNUA116]|uniref:tyrosine-type recombinase/integrase n=1 Tax=Streptomyces sp. VNUA116 TaxID=3062449 RepID=UPI002675FFF0|nr:tyrosine-type recombinase/integrase [Streptomyces sp. VNUA116]WKU44535.1 tyrosine-type recombinase/integrase [Streptomyces sp. VNUA116]
MLGGVEVAFGGGFRQELAGAAADAFGAGKNCGQRSQAGSARTRSARWGWSHEGPARSRQRLAVRICRQITHHHGTLVFAPPKGGTKDDPKDRHVPLDKDLATRLREHTRLFPPVEVTLPWLEKDGELVTVRLMFTTRERKALNGNYFNYRWKAALEAIGVIEAVNDKPVGKGRKWETRRDKMMHALRHLFASEAINEGVDVYTLADLLGHQDPAFTLRRYVHRVTGAVEKARKAIGKRYRLAA